METIKKNKKYIGNKEISLTWKRSNCYETITLTRKENGSRFPFMNQVTSLRDTIEAEKLYIELEAKYFDEI